ncbi:hypothetical protein BRC19_02845 [Candidatus Saccharibacteria bacterium QS_5_54_17]|nr:MAG: hypothetical protein BRC19_02845 [Candidatus Saccharibacteria bacterium QS_5_54_17]
MNREQEGAPDIPDRGEFSYEEEAVARLQETRPDGFGPRRLRQQLEGFVSGLSGELEELQAIYIHPDSSPYRQRSYKVDEPEMLLGPFGVNLMEPRGILFLALGEAGMPLRLTGTGSSPDAQNQPLSRITPSTGEARNVWFAYVPESWAKDVERMQEESLRNQRGLLIADAVGAAEQPVLVSDVDTAEEELLRFFMTQQVLDEEQMQVLTRAADNEAAILHSRGVDGVADSDPYYDLETAYTWYRLARAGIPPYSARELLDMQTKIYSDILESYNPPRNATPTTKKHPSAPID